MKKSLLTTCLLILFFQLISKENSLIVLHPTEYNLNVITSLINQKIINIDNLSITGVYHSKEAYDYSKSEAFLNKNSYPFIKLYEVKEEINFDDIYKQNKCTPVFENLFKNSNGVLFLGGPDLPPAIYNEKTSLLTKITDPYRHYFEVSFLFHLLGSSRNTGYTELMEKKKNYIVYAICLGMQSMNVATGGSMFQDIPSDVYNIKFAEDVLSEEKNIQHKNYYNHLFADTSLFIGSFHNIKIKEFQNLTGNKNSMLNPLVYSIHHQCIKETGKEIVVTATSADGKVIEAVRHAKYPNVTGVQFHPERIYLYNSKVLKRTKPSGRLISGKEILTEGNSYNFHLEFWALFSKKFNSINNQ